MRDWAKLMASIFYGMVWIAIILLSMLLIVAFPILVVSLFYYIITAILGLVFIWYIPVAIGLAILVLIGLEL